MQPTLLDSLGEPPHRGRPTVRRTRDGGRVLLLCPVGHLVQSVSSGDWAGSRLEAKAGDPHFEVTCHGTLPDEARWRLLCS